MNPGDQKFSLFSEIDKKLQEQRTKNTETVIEAKMNERNAKFNKKSTIEDLREGTQEKELEIRKSTRSEQFELRRRLTNSVQNSSIAIKSQIKISLQTYEQCQNYIVNVNLNLTQEKEFPEILAKFRSGDVESQYAGLVGFRKLLALRN